MKWYEKTWVIILLVILFFPVGLFLVWRKKEWSKNIKFGITIGFLLIAIIGAYNESKSKEEINYSKKIEVEKPNKEYMSKIDSEISNIFLESQKLNNELTSKVGSINDSNKLEIYELAKKIKEDQFNLRTKIVKLQETTNQEYILSCERYIINSERISKSIIKYIDKEKLSYLSEAKDMIIESDKYILKAYDERVEYLKKAGFKENEIEEITNISSK